MRRRRDVQTRQHVWEGGGGLPIPQDGCKTGGIAVGSLLQMHLHGTMGRNVNVTLQFRRFV